MLPSDISFEHYFRTEAVHRLLGGTGSAYTLGTGFLLKPTTFGSHYDWTPDHYAGVLVLRGEGRYRDWRRQEHRLEPGTFFQRIPGKVHTTTQVPDGTWAECFVRFGSGLFEELSRLGVLDAKRVIFRPGTTLTLLEGFEQVLRDMQESAESGSYRALTGMQALLVQIYEQDRHRDHPAPDIELLKEACRCLSENLNRRLDMPTVARELGCGYERFRKLFRKNMGISPGDYRIRRRMERARSMLSSGGYSVKETAYELGYPDAFTFSRQFRRAIGVPPSRLRAL